MKFVVTGFKEFSGVKENPTEFIVKNLQDYLRVRGKPLPGDNWHSATSQSVQLADESSTGEHLLPTQS